MPEEVKEGFMEVASKFSRNIMYEFTRHTARGGHPRQAKTASPIAESRTRQR